MKIGTVVLLIGGGYVLYRVAGKLRENHLLATTTPKPAAFAPATDSSGGGAAAPVSGGVKAPYFDPGMPPVGANEAQVPMNNQSNPGAGNDIDIPTIVLPPVIVVPIVGGANPLVAVDGSVDLFPPGIKRNFNYLVTSGNSTRVYTPISGSPYSSMTGPAGTEIKNSAGQQGVLQGTLEYLFRGK